MYRHQARAGCAWQPGLVLRNTSTLDSRSASLLYTRVHHQPRSCLPLQSFWRTALNTGAGIDSSQMYICVEELSPTTASKDKQLCCPLQNTQPPRPGGPPPAPQQKKQIQSFRGAPCRIHTHRSHRPPMIHTGLPQTSSLDKEEKRSQWQRKQGPLSLSDPTHHAGLLLHDGAGLF